MTPHGRLLMIACAFPPTGGSGVQRSAKFAKYLPSFGWLPTVWTIDALDGLPRDAALLEDLPPEVTVHAQHWDHRRHGTRDLIHRAAEAGGITSRLAQAVDWRVDAWLASVDRGSLPDQYISWAKAGVEPLCRLIDEEGVDAVYSTFGPPSNHWLGLMLKQRTNLPWVADFRDLWTDDYRYVETAPTRRAAHRRLEQEVLEAADVVVGVAERQTAILADHVPPLRHKFVTITNGYDPQDFGIVRQEAGLRTPEADADPSWRRDRFVLAHVGRLDRWRTNDAWFSGLRRFVECLGSERDRILFRIVGHANARTRADLDATGVPYTHTAYVPHGDAVREMRSADVLLLNVPHGRNAESVIPAKLFEYLAAQHPILVVGPPGGECESIVLASRAGRAVGFDEHAIAAALCDLYDAWRAGRPIPGCSTSRLEPFSRVTLTQRLASIIDGLAGCAPRREAHAPHTPACAPECAVRFAT
jgi:glycosyltransferase involved in cell wall biosynthesis